jgi:hypothetical protein
VSFVYVGSLRLKEKKFFREARVAPLRTQRKLQPRFLTLSAMRLSHNCNLELMLKHSETLSVAESRIGVKSQHFEIRFFESADPFVDLLTETASRVRAQASKLILVKTVDRSQLGNVPMSNSLLANGAAGTRAT